MSRRLVLLATVVLLSGCSAYDRINRLQVELKDSVRHGRMDKAAEIERRMLEISREGYGPGTIEDIQTRTDLAETWASWRYPDKAVAMADETIAELEQMYGPDDEQVAWAWLSLAKVHYILRHWYATEAALDRLSALCHPIFDATPGDTVRYSGCIGKARHEIPPYYLSIGAYEKWADAYIRLDEWRWLYQDRDGGISRLTVLGRGHADNGAWPEAIWYLQRCVDELRPRYERYAPPGGTVWTSPEGDVEVVVVDAAHSFHSQSPRCLEDLIEARRKIGEDDVAADLERWQRDLWANGPELEEPLRRRVKFADDARSYDDFTTSAFAHALAFYLANKGRTEEAIRAYGEAIGFIDRALERDGVFAGHYPAWLHVDQLLDLGPLLEQTGRFDDAEQTYLRAAAISAAEIQPNHAWHLDSLAGLARARVGRGRLDEADATWRRYLEVAERIRGTDHADYAFGLAGLADVRETAGRVDDAARSRRRAAAIRAAYTRRIESVRDLPLPVSLRSPPSPAN